ncbi:MAG: patatin-like phospholipase family protein [Frankiaceae bacterium]
MSETPGPRRGLVLGAGGILGLAWSIGALRALEEAEGFDPRTADVVIGTSAGSVLAALVGSGLSTRALVNNWQGTLDPDDPRLSYDYGGERALPPRPAARIGSSRLLLRTLAGRGPVSPLGVLAAFAPLGRGSLAALAGIIDTAAPPDWPQAPRTWIVAMDYDTGRRVVFGREDGPVVGLAQAVTASCAIPGWYAPVLAGGRRYVDGGGISTTSADLLAGLGLDEVLVLAPMVSFAYDRPRSTVARMERRLRRAWTRRLLREADVVRRSGTAVTLLGPGPEDLEVIGGNLMDPRRRAAVLETSLRTTAAALAGYPPTLRVAG